jgi:hypothetical protein
LSLAQHFFVKPPRIPLAEARERNNSDGDCFSRQIVIAQIEGSACTLKRLRHALKQCGFKYGVAG